MLQNSSSASTSTDPTVDATKPSILSDVEGPTTGIFMLNYRYSHTLNQLLFHMGPDLDTAHVALCIISSADCPETSRLPVKFGKLHIAAPKSLRQGGNYLVVDIEYNDASQMWDKISIEARVL
jgi:hypothetical protein